MDLWLQCSCIVSFIYKLQSLPFYSKKTFPVDYFSFFPQTNNAHKTLQGLLLAQKLLFVFWKFLPFHITTN